MTSFRVWTHPLPAAWRLRVEGSQNVQWLISRLSRSFFFKSSEPVRQEADSLIYTFEVLYSSQNSQTSFERLLGGIPEVNLIRWAA